MAKKQVIRATLTLTIKNGGAEYADLIRSRLSGKSLMFWGDSYAPLAEALADWLTTEALIPSDFDSDETYDQWTQAELTAKLELIE